MTVQTTRQVNAVRRLAGAAFAVAIIAAVPFSAGCESTVEADPTPVQTFKITPAADATPRVTPAGTTTASAATPLASATAATPAAGTPAAEQEELEAPAGTVTIEFDNRDSGVVHNIQVFDGDDADADSLGQTDLEIGPLTQTLTLELETGEYFYQCDAHPNTMSGTLTVR
jgi:plastocyanin